MRIKLDQTTVLKYFLLLMFLCDMMVGLLDKVGASFYRVSLFPRLIFEVVCVVNLLKMMNHRVSKNIVIIATMCLMSIVIGFGVFTLNGNDYNIGEAIVTMNKYLLVFMIFPYSLMCLQNENDRKSVEDIYKLTIVIASGFVLTGLLFNIPLFLSYDSGRFGYKGLFYAVNEASLYFIIAQLYGMYNVIYKKKWWILVLSTIASLLLGTKAGIISPFLIWMLLIFYKNRSGLKLVRFIVVLFMFGVLMKYVIVPATVGGDKVLSYFVYDASRSNVFTMFLSGRNQFVADRFIPYHTNRSMFNILFGGVNNLECTVEMDFFDLYLFMGIAGGLTFLTGYTLLFFGKGVSFFIASSFVIILTDAAIGGHVFYSANNAIYIVLLLLVGRSEIGRKRPVPV